MMNVSMPVAIYSRMRAATVSGIADESRPGAPAHQADARPEVWADLELVAASSMQRRHAVLADGIHAREGLLRFGDRGVVDVRDEPVGFGPGLFVRLANDHVEPDPKRQGATLRLGEAAHVRDFLGDLRRGLSPM